MGLVNGTKGKIIDIIYCNSKPPDLPKAVIIQFDEYLGPSFHPYIDKCVPVIPITATDDSGTKERTQIPITLGWAMTIHKSQGTTLNSAYIDIGDSDFSPRISICGFK